MKGLLIKDMRYFTQNKNLLLVVVCLVMMVMVGLDDHDPTFAIAFVTVYSGILVINSISIDDFDRSTMFLLTMPVTRKLYVLEKYVFAAILDLGGCVGVSLITCVAFSVRDPMAYVPGIISALIMIVFMQMIMLPLQLKLGGEKGRIALICVLGFAFVGALLGTRVGVGLYGSENAFYRAAGEALTGLVEFLDWGGIPLLIGLIAAMLIAGTAISLACSLRIMKNKQW